MDRRGYRDTTIPPSRDVTVVHEIGIKMRYFQFVWRITKTTRELEDPKPVKRIDIKV